MSDLPSHQRFEELDAGRVLGDLDEKEVQEWQRLSKSIGANPDLALDLVAASIETEFLQQGQESLPTDLALLLRRESGQFANSAGSDSTNVIVTPPASVWKRVFSSSEAGWAVAAVLAVLFVATFLTSRTEPMPAPTPIVVNSPTQLSPEYAKNNFLTKAPNLTKAAFGGVGTYTGLKGEVVWSDEMQEGYLTLSNLPINNPAQNQYQLWIVAPSRDEKPVDGGVFNIPIGKSTAIIPIRNSLLVQSCEAFVITLEKPGGVVVSKQEEVVAVAKVS